MLNHCRKGSYIHLLGFLLIGVGTGADTFAGSLILKREALWGIALHLPALMVWIVGIRILGRQPDRTLTMESTQGESTQGPAENRTPRHLIEPRNTLDAQTKIALILGLFLFPGLGPLGYSLAHGLGRFVGRQRLQETTDDEHGGAHPSPKAGRVIDLPINPLVELEIRPLIEVLQKTDIGMKRATLELLCRHPGPQTMSLARTLLADPDPDVRALAAVAVSSLTADFGKMLREAITQLEKQPQMAKHHAALANCYYQYAPKGPSSAGSRRFYLVQARKAFEQAVSAEPTRYEYQASLAQVLADLGESQEAWGLITKILAMHPDDFPSHLLGMEIAFKEGRFDRVATLAECAHSTAGLNSEALPLVEWWRSARRLGEPGVP